MMASCSRVPSRCGCTSSGRGATQCRKSSAQGACLRHMFVCRRNSMSSSPFQWPLPLSGFRCLYIALSSQDARGAKAYLLLQYQVLLVSPLPDLALTESGAFLGLR
ncbi:hypothetical protein NDU88_008075 [Pleurodeles waltl]|uniref:Uncharacterized protein n=1 Tax=Pleurodeles waltl TaxID=8319 RepID=A0AAV7QMG5_PLEWA|nr:hypothetical protein NDU88_008075 [Pleurodeles waltl]